MAENGAVPPVNFNKRFGKPPQQKQKRKEKQPKNLQDIPASEEQEQKPRPVDPENPPSIDFTI
jgi:hypothetical protein